MNLETGGARGADWTDQEGVLRDAYGNKVADDVLSGDWNSNNDLVESPTGASDVLKNDEEEGRTAYRLYYTLAVGSTSPNVKVDQKKVCAVAHSFDGVFSF